LNVSAALNEMKANGKNSRKGMEVVVGFMERG
jgi:hypothetical protein